MKRTAATCLRKTSCGSCCLRRRFSKAATKQGSQGVWPCARSFAQEKKRIETQTSRELAPCFPTENHKRGSPSVGLGAGARNDGDGSGRREERRTAARVHRMRKTTVPYVDPVPRVARGGPRGILQGEDRLRRPAFAVGFLDRYGPGFAVRAQAERPHLAVDTDQSGSDAEAA